LRILNNGLAKSKYLIIGFSLAFLLIVPATNQVFAQSGDSVQIPSWFKFSANAWLEGTSSDQEFADALEFLIKEKIIQSPSITILDVAPTDVTQKTQVVIPSWFKFSANAWLEGTSSDQEFADAIEFLIKEKIIRSPNIQIGDGPGPQDGTSFSLTAKEYDAIIKEASQFLDEDFTMPAVAGSLIPPECIPSTADQRIEAQTNKKIDTDLDGIPDVLEESGYYGIKTDPRNKDTDGDGLTDLREFWWNLDPTNPDTDGDHTNDGPSIDAENPKDRRYPYASSLEALYELGIDDDKDGIPNAAEVYDTLTDPNDRSTDGDRYGDGTEYFATNTADDDLPAWLENPDHLTPEVPDIIIRVDQNVILQLNEDVVIGSTTMEGKEYTLSNSEETQQTHGFSTTVGSRQEISYSYPPSLISKITGGGGPDVKLTLFSEQSYNYDTSTTTSTKKDKTYFTASEAYTGKKVNYGETNIKYKLLIENIGNDHLLSDLEQITLNFYLGLDDEFPIESERLTSEAEDLRFSQLEPGKTITFSHEFDLTYPEFVRFMAGEEITAVASHYSFGDDQTWYNKAKASNLEFIIADDQGVEKRFVRLPVSMNLEEFLLCEGIDFLLDAKGDFTKIDDMILEIDKTPYKVLNIVHTPNPNDPRVTTSSDEMILKNGDRLLIRSQTDSDGDFLTDQEELQRGTNPLLKDTDDDGLWDGYSFPEASPPILGELTKYCEITEKNPFGFTHPLIADTDGDGTNDFDEVVKKPKTDPCVAPEKPKPADTFLTGTNDFSMPVARNLDGRLEVFALAPGNGLVHSSNSNIGWSSWQPLGGWHYEIEIGQNKDGRLQAFGIGSSSDLWYKTQTIVDGKVRGWEKDWTNLGGWHYDIAVAQNLDGRLQVFAIGTYGKVYTIWQDTINVPSWSEWKELGGGEAKEIAVVQNKDGGLEVFVIWDDNSVRHSSQTTAGGNEFTRWNNLGGVTRDALREIEVGLNGDGRLEVFVIGINNQVYHNWQTTPGGGWSGGWTMIQPGVMFTEIDVGRNLDGQLQVFAVGADFQVHTSLQRDGWNGWKPLGGQIAKDIAVAQNADGRLEIFRLDADGNLSTKWQISPNGAEGWSLNWHSLGGGGGYWFGNE